MVLAWQYRKREMRVALIRSDPRPVESNPDDRTSPEAPDLLLIVYNVNERFTGRDRGSGLGLIQFHVKPDIGRYASREGSGRSRLLLR
jgi:hypothetical protein